MWDYYGVMSKPPKAVEVTTFNLRLSIDMHEKLRKAADRNLRSMNNEILVRLRESLKEEAA